MTRPSIIAIICLILGLLGTLPLVILTPPLQVPDEGQHFARAYQLSEFRIWSKADANGIGDTLPTSLTAFIVHFLGTARVHAERPVTSQPLSATWTEHATPLAPDDRSFIAFEGAAFYSPLAYIPQALAMRVARALGGGPLALFYAGRLANALTAVLLLAAAIRIVPYGKELMLVAALLPMALYQYASLSPDALVIGSAFLFTAIALRAQARRAWPWRDVFTAIVTGTIFCSLKPVYLPLLLIGLLPDVFERGRRARVLGVHLLIFVCVVGATWIWMRSTASVFSLPRPGTNLREQATFVLTHPVDYAMVLISTLHAHWLTYLQSMVGVFGWFTILPSPILLVLPVMAAALAIVGRSDTALRPSRGTALWAAATVVGSALLVFTSLYLIWTPIGAGAVEGVQGRYFLPLLGAAAVAASRMWPPRAKSRVTPPTLLAILVGLTIGQLVLTDLTIVSAYSVF